MLRRTLTSLSAVVAAGASAWILLAARAAVDPATSPSALAVEPVATVSAEAPSKGPAGKEASKATAADTSKPTLPPASTPTAPLAAAEHPPQPFDDLQSIGQDFADALAKLKDEGKTVSPAELFRQAESRRNYTVTPQRAAGKRLDAEAIYAQARPSVLIVGGLYHCPKCQRWHVRAASGFVVGRDGLVVTNYHVVEGYKGLDALGVRTDAGRVLAVKAVLAASRLDDLALVKVDADDLVPLPVADDVAVGATVYCLSHPSLSTEKTNCFFAFSHGMAAGKFTLHTERQQPYNVLAVTAEYGLGSSGGPILNDRGAVVGVACQAVPQFQREQDKGVMMVWRLARPSSSLLPMFREPDPRKPPRRLRPRGSRSTAAEDETKPAAAKSDAARADAARADVAKSVAARAADVAAMHAPAAKTPGPGAVSPELRPCAQARAGYYRPISIVLSEKPPFAPKTEPKYVSPKPLYGVLTLGEGKENRFLVALDEPEGGTPKIYIDRQGDGDLARAQPGDWQRNTPEMLGLGSISFDVPYASGKLPYTLSFYRFKNRLRDRLLYYRVGGREGEVTLDGQRYRLLVLDDNADGRFDDLKNGSLILDLNQDGKLEPMVDSAEYYTLTEPFNVRGKVWEVASLSPDGLRITLQPSKAEAAIKAYLNPGCVAPDFRGKGLDEKPIELSAQAAKARFVLVDFWASWCGPCRAEFPTLRRVWARYKDHGLVIVGVNLDTERPKAIAVAEKSKLDYAHVFDGLGWKNAVAVQYRVHGIPQVYLLDAERKIVAKNLRGAGLEKRLQELLGPGDEAAAKAVDDAIRQEAAKAADKKAGKAADNPPAKAVIKTP